MVAVPTPSMMLLLTDPHGLDAAADTTREMLEEWLESSVDCGLPLSHFLSVRAVEALTGELAGFDGGLSAQALLALSELDTVPFAEVPFLTRVTERDVREARLRRAVVPLALEQLAVEVISEGWDTPWEESVLSHVFPVQGARLDRADLAMFTYRSCRRLIEALSETEVERPAVSIAEEFLLYHACIRWAFPLRFIGVDAAWVEPQHFLLANSEFLLLFADDAAAAGFAPDGELAAAYTSPHLWFVPFGEAPVFDD